MSKFRFLIAALVVLSPTVALADGIFQASYNETITFPNMTGNQHAQMIAFDGTHYWSCDGGSTGGDRLSEYDASGTWLANYQPGIDFRSCFTNNNTSPLYACEHDSNVIRVQTSPGVFGTHVTLTGGSLDDQSSVVLNSNGGGDFIAMSGGLVNSWGADGNHNGTTTLSGFGTMFDEASYPANCKIASAAGVLPDILRRASLGVGHGREPHRHDHPERRRHDLRRKPEPQLRQQPGFYCGRRERVVARLLHSGDSRTQHTVASRPRRSGTAAATTVRRLTVCH